MSQQMYELKITANGEVRDVDGNLISSQPIETTIVVTEEEMLTLTQGDQT